MVHVRSFCSPKYFFRAHEIRITHVESIGGIVVIFVLISKKVSVYGINSSVRKSKLGFNSAVKI